MNVIIQILLGVSLSVLIPVAISCVQMLITELKYLIITWEKHTNDKNNDM